MSNDTTWRGGEPPVLPQPHGLGWLRVARRGGLCLLILGLGVLGLILLRGVERIFAGSRRPLTGPWVQGVCRGVLWAVGIRLVLHGTAWKGAGAAVANHAGWMDIFVLNAALPVFFVSKSEVRTWPGINILTAVTDTHFVTRDPKLARQQAEEFTARVRSGHRLLFFPEGTSSDSRRVLPFKPTLFQGFLDPALPEGLVIQPVTVVYHAPPGLDPRFYGWWGDMDLGPHLLAVLAVPRQGRVEVVLHPPVAVVGETRKSLAAKTETAVRAGLPFSG